MLPNATQPKKRPFKASKKSASKKHTLTNKVDYLMKTTKKLKPEYKYYTQAIGTNSAIDDQGVSLQNMCNSIGNGTGDQNRIGEEIRGQNLTLRYHAVSAAQAKVRVIVFVDKQDYFPAVGGTSVLLEPFSTSSPAPNNINAFYADDTKRLKRVLYDKVHCLTDGGGLEQSVVTNIRLSNMLIGYRNDGVCIKNNIKYAFLSDQPTSGGTVVQVYGQARLSFTDD